MSKDLLGPHRSAHEAIVVGMALGALIFLVLGWLQ